MNQVRLLPDTLDVLSYWGPRHETSLQAATSFAEIIAAVGTSCPDLVRWYHPPPTWKKVTSNPIPVEPGQLAHSFKIEDSILTETLRGVAQNGVAPSSGGMRAELSFVIGDGQLSRAMTFSNNFLLKLHDIPDGSLAQGWPASVHRLLSAIVNSARPDHITVGQYWMLAAQQNTGRTGRVGWITYKRVPAGTSPSVPALPDEVTIDRICVHELLVQIGPSPDFVTEELILHVRNTLIDTGWLVPQPMP